MNYREALRFVAVGGSSSLVYFVVAVACVELLGLSNMVSIIIAYATGTIVSYIGAAFFAFGANTSNENFAKFLIVVAISFAVNIINTEVLTRIGAHITLISVFNIAFSGVFNYLMHKYWTFK